MPTQKDVARSAEVSIATVSRFINQKGFISPPVKQRIRQAILELGYKPNLVARSLKIRSSKTIGLVFPDIENPFFISLITKAEEVARENGYNVILCNTENSPDKEVEYLEILKGKLVDGYIMIPAISTGSALEQLLEHETVVFLDRAIEGLENRIVVKLDNRKGVAMAVDYLSALGHTRIGLVGVPTNITTGLERFEGYRAALSHNGLEMNESLVRFADFSVESAYRSAAGLLAGTDRPTAVLPLSGPTTVGTLKAIRDAGLRIPSDISIIGFDEFVYAELLNPPLTTVAQPAYEFGRKGAELLINLLKREPIHEKTLVLSPTLIKRDSCKYLR